MKKSQDPIIQTWHQPFQVKQADLDLIDNFLQNPKNIFTSCIL